MNSLWPRVFSLLLAVSLLLVAVLVTDKTTPTVPTRKSRFQHHDKFVVVSEGAGFWGKRVVNMILYRAFPDREIVWMDQNTDRPDLIVRSKFKAVEPFCQFDHVPYITWSGESTPVDQRGYSPLFCLDSFRSSNPRSIWMPHLFTRLLELGYLNDRGLPTTKHQTLATNEKRSRFLAYVNSNCVPYRERLFDLIRQRRPEAEALGKCSNTGTRLPEGQTENIYAEFVFGMALENEQKDGYITEKVMNVLAGNAIPIFHGDTALFKQLFNAEKAVCMDDFESEVEVADHIAQMSEEEILHKQRLPIFKNDEFPELLTVHSPDVTKAVFLLRQQFK